MKRSVFHSQHLVFPGNHSSLPQNAAPGAARVKTFPVPVTAGSFQELWLESQDNLARDLASWYAASRFGIYFACDERERFYRERRMKDFADEEGLPAMTRLKFTARNQDLNSDSDLSGILIWGHETSAIRSEKEFRARTEARLQEHQVKYWSYLSFSSGEICSRERPFSAASSSEQEPAPEPNLPPENADPRSGTVQDPRLSGIRVDELVFCAVTGRPREEYDAARFSLNDFDIHGKNLTGPLALMLYQKLEPMGVFRKAAEPESLKRFVYNNEYDSGVPAWTVLPDPEKDLFLRYNNDAATAYYLKFLDIPGFREKLTRPTLTLADIPADLYPDISIQGGLWWRHAFGIFKCALERDSSLPEKIARSRGEALLKAVTPEGTSDNRDPLAIPEDWKFTARVSFRDEDITAADPEKAVSENEGLQDLFRIGGELKASGNGMRSLDFTPGADYGKWALSRRDGEFSPSAAAVSMTGNLIPGYAALNWFFIRVCLLADTMGLKEFSFAFDTPYRPGVFIRTRYRRRSENSSGAPASPHGPAFAAFREFRKRVSFFNSAPGAEPSYDAAEIAIAPEP